MKQIEYRGRKYAVKPCPFCGSTPRVYEHNHVRRLCCPNLDCDVLVQTVGWPSDEGGIKRSVMAWNTRAEVDEND